MSDEPQNKNKEKTPRMVLGLIWKSIIIGFFYIFYLLMASWRLNSFYVSLIFLFITIGFIVMAWKKDEKLMPDERKQILRGMALFALWSILPISYFILPLFFGSLSFNWLWIFYLLGTIILFVWLKQKGYGRVVTGFFVGLAILAGIALLLCATCFGMFWLS